VLAVAVDQEKVELVLGHALHSVCDPLFVLGRWDDGLD